MHSLLVIPENVIYTIKTHGVRCLVWAAAV